MMVFVLMIGFNVQTISQTQVSPTIDELGQVVNGIENQFKDLRGKMILEEENGSSYYSTLEHDKANMAVIAAIEGAGAIYTIVYRYDGGDSESIAKVLNDYLGFAAVLKENGNVSETEKSKIGDNEYTVLKISSEKGLPIYDLAISKEDFRVNFYSFP